MASILAQIGTAVGQELKALNEPTPPTDEHKKLVYGADGALAYIQVYSDQGLSNLISSKAFTYTSGALSEIKSYALGQLVFTQSMTYDSNGSLVNIVKDYA